MDRIDRRGFLRVSAGMTVGAGTAGGLGCDSSAGRGRGVSTSLDQDLESHLPPRQTGRPVVVSTWRHGIAANQAAAAVLDAGGAAFDAVEKGVIVSESDPEVSSVGKGGLPNAAGVVQLDACIMDGPRARAGAVCALEGIENAISVARKVMEHTPHVMLGGAGAQTFALAHGFETTNLLTEAAKKRWKEWKREQGAEPAGHDTIGMCALDQRGDLATACTTSGLAWKVPGRVGDSPLVGGGSFVDNDVGAAAATGVGEEILQVCGSFLVVENMRHGMEPEEACKHVVQRIFRKHPDAANVQVAFIALRRDGAVGAYCMRQTRGLTYAHYDGREHHVTTAKALIAEA